MQPVLLLALAFAINKTVSVLKAITNGEWRTTVTQLLVWAVGFVALVLAANSDLMSHLIIEGFDRPLGVLDWQSLLLTAWILGGSGSFLYDFKKAIDNSDSASETQLKVGTGGGSPTGGG